MYSHIFVYTVYIQGWTNPGCQVARSMKFSTVGPPYGACFLLHFWRLEFWSGC